MGRLSPSKLTVATTLCGSGIILGSSCGIESYKQFLIYDFAVALTARSATCCEDKKSNNTERAY